MWTRLRATVDLGHRHHALVCPVAVAEEVPELDPVTGRVEEVGGAVAAVVLQRAFHLDVALTQALAELLQAVVVDREGEVDMATAAVGVLLLAGRPDAEAAVLAGGHPEPVTLLQQRGQAQLDVEVPQAPGVVGLEDQLADSSQAHLCRVPFSPAVHAPSCATVSGVAPRPSLAVCASSGQFPCQGWQFHAPLM